MARQSPKAKAAGRANQKLHIDNAPPLGSRPSTKMVEGGQDAEAKDYPAKPSRPGGKKNKPSPSIVTKGKGG